MDGAPRLWVGLGPGNREQGTNDRGQEVSGGLAYCLWPKQPSELLLSASKVIGYEAFPIRDPLVIVSGHGVAAVEFSRTPTGVRSTQDAHGKSANSRICSPGAITCAWVAADNANAAAKRSGSGTVFVANSTTATGGARKSSG
ncbi:MAG TPA: hypothetical protein VI636_25640 [Candidatus Angelobacter sp.]